MVSGIVYIILSNLTAGSIIPGGRLGPPYMKERLRMPVVLFKGANHEFLIQLGCLRRNYKLVRLFDCQCIFQSCSPHIALAMKTGIGGNQLQYLSFNSL